MKEKIINFCRWLKSEIKDKNTAILFLIVVAIMYAPVWCGYLLYFLFRWSVCFVVASAYLAFWAGPFTPFFPLCIAITLFLKKLFEKRQEKMAEKQENQPENPPLVPEEKAEENTEENAADDSETNAVS